MFQKLLGPKTSSLDTTIAELEREWLPSARRKSLVRLIEKYILPNPRIEIDSALCLGLGRFRKGFFRRLRFLCGSHSDGDDEENVEKRLRIWDCEFDTSFEDEGEGEGEGEGDDSTDHEMNRVRTLTRDAGAPNSSLYQLLLFETVLECLRSKFRIPHSLIQDPAFTAADRAFLSNRGHTVLPYPPRLSGRRDGFPLDPSLLPRISNRTFFFAPALDIHVDVDVLLAAKPSLYWGHDMCLNVAYPHFLNPLSRGYVLLDSYAALASSYTFLCAPIPNLSSANAGFMYPVDTSDLKAAGKVQRRVEQGVADAESLRPWILRIVEENRLKKERSKEKRRKRKRWTKRSEQ